MVNSRGFRIWVGFCWYWMVLDGFSFFDVVLCCKFTPVFRVVSGSGSYWMLFVPFCTFWTLLVFDVALRCKCTPVFRVFSESGLY